MMKKIFLSFILLTSLTFGQSEVITVFDDQFDNLPSTKMIVRTSEGHIVRTSETKVVTVINNLMVFNNEEFNENYIFNRFAMYNEFVKPDLSELNANRYRITKHIK